MSKTTINDIFISYRRDGGGATAGRINDLLTADGFTVTYDVKTLREGRFDEQLLERIEQCQDFVLVVDKACFVRTLDPQIDPQDDWVRQELAYALRLKKNIIPVLMDGAVFPKGLPVDIDEVRRMNGPRCVHEYFESFYTELKDKLHACPRLAQPSSDGAHVRHYLKLKPDLDCIFYLDGEEQAHLKARVLKKYPLEKGEYELMFVSEDNDCDRLEKEFEMPDEHTLQKVNLSGIRDARLQREAEEERKRREEEERSKRSFIVGGVEFNMIRVEGGSFMMGAPDNDPDAFDDEKPQHDVTLSDYYIGETPVTQALWNAVMGENPSHFEGGYSPVEEVSWTDCQEFIKKLNSKTGRTFRLPTEAEWEYAARGGIKSKGYRYAGSDNIDEVAWYGEKSGNKTHPVKQKKANELDLYDMSGYVWEWCQDWFDRYGSGKETNPTGPSGGSLRVLRGGSWGSDAQNCRVAYRDCLVPSSRFDFIGFRLALVQQ